MNKLSNKQIKSSSLLLTGTIIFILGIIIIIYNTSMYKLFIKLIALAICINGLNTIIKVLTKRVSPTSNLTVSEGIINILISCFMLYFLNITLSLLPIVMAIYLLFNSFIKLVDFLIKKKNHLTGKLFSFISFIFFLTFFFILLCYPLISLKRVLQVIGIYFIMYALSDISQFINLVTTNKTKNKIKRRIRISLPVFLVTFIPHNTLKEINKYLEVKDKDIHHIKIDSNKENPDIEVIIHVSDSGSGVFGHCDIFFEGRIISYGSYDEASSKLFNSIGDGIIFTTHEKKKYINLCVKHSKKTLFIYGIKLTPTEKDAVRNKINEIFDNLYLWKSPYEEAFLSNKKIKFTDFKDYPSILYHDTNSKIYKFTKGRFKTYFLFSTNCVYLVDTILGAGGTDIIKMNGIITPGTYYDYLERLYHDKNSNVITKEIYR